METTENDKQGHNEVAKQTEQHNQHISNINHMNPPNHFDKKTNQWLQISTYERRKSLGEKSMGFKTTQKSKTYINNKIICTSNQDEQEQHNSTLGLPSVKTTSHKCLYAKQEKMQITENPTQTDSSRYLRNKQGVDITFSRAATETMASRNAQRTDPHNTQTQAVTKISKRNSEFQRKLRNYLLKSLWV